MECRAGFRAASVAPPSGELLVPDEPTRLRRQPVNVSDRRGAGDGGTDLQPGQRENVISWLVGGCRADATGETCSHLWTCIDPR